MTQQQRLLDLLREFGVTPNVGVSSIELVAKSGEVSGYVGFRCVFEFDEAGAFRSVGVWE